MNKKLLLIAASLISTTSFASVDITATAYGATCKKGFMCELTGKHSVIIVNDTDNDQNYHYRYSLCADNGDCVRQEKDIGLPAHQRFENRWDSHLTTRFMVVTTHYNYAQTEVYGAERKFADSKGWVTVNP